MRKCRFLGPANLVVTIVVLMAVGLSFPQAASAQDQVPIYEVDPFWPKTPLPNNWVLGNVIGTAVDPSNDHVWIVHRPASLTNNEIPLYHNPPTGEDCCMPAPPILEFDQDGNLVGHFGIDVNTNRGYKFINSCCSYANLSQMFFYFIGLFLA